MAVDIGFQALVETVKGLLPATALGIAGLAGSIAIPIVGIPLGYYLLKPTNQETTVVNNEVYKQRWSHTILLSVLIYVAYKYNSPYRR